MKNYRLNDLRVFLLLHTTEEGLCISQRFRQVDSRHRPCGLRNAVASFSHDIVGDSAHQVTCTAVTVDIALALDCDAPLGDTEKNKDDAEQTNANKRCGVESCKITVQCMIDGVHQKHNQHVFSPAVCCTVSCISMRL
jgi:hypothetical protein